MAATRGDATAWAAHLSLLGNIQYFLAGFLLADFFLSSPPAGRRSSAWDVVSAIGWPCLGFFLVHNPQAVSFALPGILTLLCAAGCYGKVTSRVLASPWATATGGMCYSIYLLHNYTIAALGAVTQRIGAGLSFDLRLVVQTLIIAPVVLILCLAFYCCIERPCMDPAWPARLRDILRRRMLRTGQSRSRDTERAGVAVTAQLRRHSSIYEAPGKGAQIA
jgi:peptidoglycan/LPS O-acetylase OafA/YrhL